LGYDALAEADSVSDALEALERSADLFARYSSELEMAGDAVYETASELSLDFRKRAYRRVATLD